MRAILVAAFIVTGAAAMAAAAGANAQVSRTVPESPAQIQLSFAPVVARVAPAVVNVYARRVVRQAYNPFANDPFFSRFFGNLQQRERIQQSLGSGVIVRADGVIITNYHVIEGAQDIRIALPDRREFQASVILSDPRTDLAVLQIDADGETLPTVPFGDSDLVQVGDLVLAIGDPYGVGQTVTSGIVSALARTDIGVSDYQFFIQTDAAINPGNSGGALVTMDGRLIGINASIVSQSGGNVGIGFAIPVNMVARVVEGALGGGIERPWFGVQGQSVDADIARSLGLARPQGMLVSRVFPGGPAAQAGVVRGDVILSIDDLEVNDLQGLNYRVATHRPGDEVQVRFLNNGEARTATVRVNLPPDADRQETLLTDRSPLQGVRVANLTPALADEMQMDFEATGVVIVGVDNTSQAARFGFRPGDIVREINGGEIDSVTTLRKVLTSAASWSITLQRGNQVLSLTVR